MLDLRRIRSGTRTDGDDIKPSTTFTAVVDLHILHGHPADSLLLTKVDRLEGGTEMVVTPAFDLDKNENAFLLGDNVYLAKAFCGSWW